MAFLSRAVSESMVTRISSRGSEESIGREKVTICAWRLSWLIVRVHRKLTPSSLNRSDQYSRMSS